MARKNYGQFILEIDNTTIKNVDAFKHLLIECGYYDDLIFLPKELILHHKAPDGTMHVFRDYKISDDRYSIVFQSSLIDEDKLLTQWVGYLEITPDYEISFTYSEFTVDLSGE